MRRRAAAVVVAVAATIVAVFAIYGERFAYGGVVLRVTDQHGVHTSDLLVLTVWLAVVVVCAVWWRREAHQ